MRIKSFGGCLVVLLAAGCSFNFSVGGDKGPRATAIKVIQDELAAGIGLGKLVATCDEPPKDIGVGDAFDCRAKTREDGEIKFLATMATKDRVDVVTTNLITSQGMDKIEKVAVGIVDDKVGGSLGTENFDCGEGPMIFDPESDKLNCELTDPDNGDIYDTEVTLSDLSDDGKVSIKVADKPKK